MDIFYKTEVQTVILRCLTCLYLNLFKSYDTKSQKLKNSKKAKLTKLVNSCKNIFKYFQAFLWIPQWITEIHRPSISHFKAFGMTNLQYEIRVPQKTIGQPQYTTALGMIFYGTDVTCLFLNSSTVIFPNLC